MGVAPDAACRTGNHRPVASSIPSSCAILWCVGMVRGCVQVKLRCVGTVRCGVQVELRCREDMTEKPLVGGAPRPVPLALQMARHLRWLAPRIPCVQDLEFIALVGAVRQLLEEQQSERRRSDEVFMTCSTDIRIRCHCSKTSNIEGLLAHGSALADAVVKGQSEQAVTPPSAVHLQPQAAHRDGKSCSSASRSAQQRLHLVFCITSCITWPLVDEWCT